MQIALRSLREDAQTNVATADGAEGSAAAADGEATTKQGADAVKQVAEEKPSVTHIQEATALINNAKRAAKPVMSYQGKAATPLTF